MNRIAFLFLLALATGVARANDDKLVRHQYDEQAAAIKAGNVKRFLATIDPSFTQFGTDHKTLTFAQYKPGISQLVSALKSATLKFKLGPIKYANGTAIVDYAADGDLIFPKDRRIHDVEKGRDTWKKVGGTYLQVHEVVTFSKQTPIARAPVRIKV